MARKILLADDSVTAQNMGRKILADAGYEVIAVNNGSAALKKIVELKPDLVILDVYMPGYSGLEVCQRLKESPETARIPVLLTVGKLEPFKPEEAQRVRAEGFIVKPFEASELLSTLSKLEDKVVPRAEPSKPGRFARAIAAAEEAGRGGRNETSSEDGGWKSRIGFPKQKTEPEESAVEEATAREAEKKEQTRPASGEAAETSIDVASLAPVGLPKDVTPEEVAAIAAAAAQIQMAGASKEEQIPETRASEATGQAPLRPLPDKLEADVPPPPVEETKAAAPSDNNKESKTESVEAAASETYRRRKGDARPEETQDIPVTMAATAESVAAASGGGSRWTAVSVALEAEEATIALDQEMQKAHASVSQNQDKASAAATTVPEVVAASAGNSSAPAEAPVAAISNPEPEPVPEPKQAMSTAEPEPVPAAQSEPAVTSSVAADLVASEPASLPEPASAFSKQPETTVPAPVTAEVTPVEAPAAASPAAEMAKSSPSPAPEAEPPLAEAAAASSNPFALLVRDAEPAAEPKADSEAVKSTAAAWATWRQVRDTGKSEMAEAQPKESDSSESAPAETNARAAAAGAEQILQEASAAAASGDSGNVASIVDSVLADLRPKLMEEISRKMSEKK